MNKVHVMFALMVCIFVAVVDNVMCVSLFIDVYWPTSKTYGGVIAFLSTACLYDLSLRIDECNKIT
ncbi:MAG: hypothetical protein JKX75_06205 [Gammaproteobacteria bacterium]|nr:hypothetical protein [Gammaproteobacteria bacterium]